MYCFCHFCNIISVIQTNECIVVVGGYGNMQKYSVLRVWWRRWWWFIYRPFYLTENIQLYFFLSLLYCCSVLSSSGICVNLFPFHVVFFIFQYAINFLVAFIQCWALYRRIHLIHYIRIATLFKCHLWHHGFRKK